MREIHEILTPPFCRLSEMGRGIASSDINDEGACWFWVDVLFLAVLCFLDKRANPGEGDGMVAESRL